MKTLINTQMTCLEKSKWVYFGIFGILMLIMPYFRGLFFDTNFYWFELIIGMLFTILILHFRKNGQSEPFQSYISYSILGLVVVYFLSALISPVGFLAFQEAFRWLIYGLSFIGLTSLLDHRKINLLIHILFGVVIWTTLFGLLAHYDLVTFTDAIIWERIASVFQYPNTFAAIIAAGMLGIFIYTTDQSQVWFVRLMYLMFLIPLAVVFVYTQSRATLVMLPIAWLIAMVFMNVRQQLQYFTATVLLALSVVPILVIYDDYLVEKNAWIILLMFVVGIVYATVTLGIQYVLLQKIKLPFQKYSRMILPSIMIILVVAGVIFITSPKMVQFLPETLADRLSDINLDTRSVTERGTFYKDSLVMFLDYPILGAGGNSWKEMYYSYQSLPYTSTQTHSFFMKLLVEVGVIGVILFVSFIGLLGYSMYKWLRKYGFGHDRIMKVGLIYTMSFMLFLHSLVDFDMSYGYFALLWFTLLSMLYVEVRDSGTELCINKKWIISTMSWFTVILTVIVLFFVGANAYASTIKVNGLTYEEALDRMNTKVSLSPYNVSYRLQRMEILLPLAKMTGDETYQQQILNEAIKLSESNTHSPTTLMATAQYFAQFGYGKNVINLGVQSLEKAPWLLTAYEQNISYHVQVIEALVYEGQFEYIEQLMKNVIVWMDQLEEQIQYLKTMPASLQYPEYKMSEEIRLYGGKVFALNGDFERAHHYLEPLSNSKDNDLRLETIVWLSILEEKENDPEQASKWIKMGTELSDEFEYKRLVSMGKLDVISNYLQTKTSK